MASNYKTILIDEKIDATNDKFFAILDDFKKYYIFYNKNPEYDEYANLYSGKKSDIQSLNKDMFVLTNDIQKNIDDLNKSMIDIDAKITKEKQKNMKLLKLVSGLKEQNDSSDIMIDNYRETYKLLNLSNILLFLGILLEFVVIFRVYKKQVPIQK